MTDEHFAPSAEKSEKTDKFPTALLYNIVSDWVNHKEKFLPEVFKVTPFPRSYRSIKQDLAEDMPTILEQYKDKRGNPLVRFSSLKSMTMEVGKVLKNIAIQDPEYYQMNMTSQAIEKALHHWAIMSTTNGGIPPAMVGHDDRRPAFYRLQYEPSEATVTPEWQCPTWNEIGQRTTNWDAFCMRVASIFDEHADRKQAIYMSGPKDCGKSQIEAMLAHLSGGDTPSGGGYCSLAPDQSNGAHWLEPIVGKRVVCISEAASDFLESSRFKSLTGDLWHMVNPKGKSIVNRPLPVLLFLFGNEPPEIAGKDELLERVVDCRISPPNIDRERLIPDHEYQAMLKDELTEFLGYCYQLYQNYHGRRLPCGRDTLEESSGLHESYATDFLLAYWTLDPDGEVPGNVVMKRMNYDGIRRGQSQRAIHDIWQRRHGIYKKREKFGMVFKGMRRRTPEEATNANLDVPFER